MGTRSLTVFKEFDGTEIVVMYRQMDGYPRGHGADLKEFLLYPKPMKLVNGIPGGSWERMANGMPCLAAQVISHFKLGVDIFNMMRAGVGGPKVLEGSGIYLHPAGTRDCGENYIYTLWPSVDLWSGDQFPRKNDSTEILIKVEYTYEHDIIYEGPVTGFEIPD